MRIDPSDKKISDMVEAIVGMAEEDYGLLTSHMMTILFDLFSSKKRMTEKNPEKHLKELEFSYIQQ